MICKEPFLSLNIIIHNSPAYLRKKHSFELPVRLGFLCIVGNKQQHTINHSSKLLDENINARQMIIHLLWYL
jgi:hypothetical protein